MTISDQVSVKSNSPARPTVSTRHLLLAGLLLLFVALKILLIAMAPQPTALASDLTKDNILQAVNRERQLRNLLTLNTDARLSSAAQSKTDDMQARHYFAHVDPDGK